MITSSAEQLVLRCFARGKRSRLTGAPTYADFGRDQPELDELLAAKLVTKHRRWKRKVIEYRGTEECREIAFRAAVDVVPARGKPPVIVSSRKIIGERKVPNPLLTPAEYDYQRRRRPDDPTVGRVTVTENVMTRIGALAYIRSKLDHHEKAAELFKSRYEALYGSGNPAIDAGRVQVDTSIMAHDSGMAAKIDRARTLLDAMDHLGKSDTDRLVATLVLCIPVSEATGAKGRALEREVDRLLGALDKLAEYWRLKRAVA